MFFVVLLILPWNFNKNNRDASTTQYELKYSETCSFRNCDSTKKYVVIFRHAEKFENGSKHDSLNSLSPTGFQRSLWLTTWIVNVLPNLIHHAPVGLIVTSQPTLMAVHLRPLQTVTPAAVALKLAIKISPDISSAMNVTKEWLNVHNGTVLICWQHQELQELLKVFGYNVPIWKDSDYDTVYIIDLRKNKLSSAQLDFKKDKNGSNSKRA